MAGVTHGHQHRMSGADMGMRETAPLDELEDAHEHAEILLDRYAGMLSAQLSALLSAWHTDLAVMIEDRYARIPDDDGA